MAARTLVVDSGGTTRLVKSSRFFVIDSGAVARKIKRLFVIDGGGVARLVYNAALLETTITIGDDGVSTFGYTVGLYGSIGSDTYTDAGANSRTIALVQWNGTAVQIFMNGASIPDTDTTFTSIVINGITFLRSARTTYDGAASGGTKTKWLWSPDPGGEGFSGTIPFVVT